MSKPLAESLDELEAAIGRVETTLAGGKYAEALLYAAFIRGSCFLFRRLLGSGWRRVTNPQEVEKSAGRWARAAIRALGVLPEVSGDELVGTLERINERGRRIFDDIFATAKWEDGGQ